MGTRRRLRHSFNSRSRMGSDPHARRPLHLHHWFQFTLPHGERRAPPPPNPPFPEFQFTLPHGERPHRRRRPRILRSFNSRSRMGSDMERWPSLPSMVVSIHAPAWGATWSRAIWMPSSWFQFTLPHGERPLDAAPPTKGAWVSIHAPAWGATQARERCIQALDVSIHAPAWGATKRRPWLMRLLAFQFTLPHGERLYEPPPALY